MQMHSRREWKHHPSGINKSFVVFQPSIFLEAFLNSKVRSEPLYFFKMYQQIYYTLLIFSVSSFPQEIPTSPVGLGKNAEQTGVEIVENMQPQCIAELWYQKH
jgi:hypothetical protein